MSIKSNWWAIKTVVKEFFQNFSLPRPIGPRPPRLEPLPFTSNAAAFKPDPDTAHFNAAVARWCKFVELRYHKYPNVSATYPITFTYTIKE